jgi:spermidine synthase
MVTSAALLFLIQPIVAKQLLPLMGGAAAVWATCMVYFQALLLCGYLYAHWSVRRLSARAQTATHLLLLTFSVGMLFLPAGFQPNVTAVRHPVFQCIAFISGTVGLPYFVLASTTPLLQDWYARDGAKVLPYRLFALSNLASLLALLAYPVVVEPAFELKSQLWIWRLVYVAFALLCGTVAVRALRLRVRRERGDENASRGNWGRVAAWLSLAWCSSALLLAATNILTQDLAPIPLLWILPLVVYLVSFILCFDREGWYRVAWFRLLVPPSLVGLLWIQAQPSINSRIAIPVCVGALFILCMFCHGQLAELKPARGELTRFYLSLSAGGAAGGLFVGLLAPALFAELFEFRIALAATLVLALRFLFKYRSRTFLGACGIASLVFLHAFALSPSEGTVLYRGRNFYGALRVEESRDGRITQRSLVHGRIIHGGQMISGAMAQEPTWYYGRESGAGLALARPRTGRRVGIIGLGVGTLATYGQEGDSFRFYEINPIVVELARSRFTYLRDSRAAVEVVLGDARLSLDREGDRRFDTLVLDAFSSDSIPIHLLTREAFDCYFRHLDRDGVLAVHVSNRYLDLSPVVAGLAGSFGKQAFRVTSRGDSERTISPAVWILVGSDFGFHPQSSSGVLIELLPSFQSRRLWTDQYSSVWRSLR